MEGLKPPPTLVLDSADLAKTWESWKEEFTLYTDLTEPSAEETTKVKLFNYLLGERGRELLTTLESGRRTVRSMMALFDDHCHPTLNETVERYAFFVRNQGQDENIDKYVTDLRVLASTCNFGDIKDSLIRDRIVCGTNSSVMRERLLREENLTLDKCMQICRAAELSTLEETHAVKWSPRRDKKEEINCNFGGNLHEKNELKCPAFGKKCGKENHFASTCESKLEEINKSRPIHGISESNGSCEDIMTITDVYGNQETINQVKEAHSKNQQLFAGPMPSPSVCDFVKMSYLDQTLQMELVRAHVQIPMSPGPELDLEITETPRIKEEPEEPSVKQEEEQLPVPVPESRSVCVKTEEASPLQHRQTEHREETQGEDISSEPHVHSETEGHTEHSSDTDDDDDWEPPGFPAAKSTGLFPKYKSAPESSGRDTKGETSGAERKKHRCPFAKRKSYSRKESFCSGSRKCRQVEEIKRRGRRLFHAHSMENTRRSAYDAEFKLKAIDLADKEGNRAAARQLSVHESMIRRWRGQSEQLTQCKKTTKAFRGMKSRWPELENTLADWVNLQRADGRGISTVQIRMKAKTISTEKNIDDFKGGASWCLRFLKRKGLSVKSVTKPDKGPFDRNVSAAINV